MIYINAAAYSRQTYARFRSSLAFERFVSAPHDAGRAASLRWARAWLLAARREDGTGQQSAAPRSAPAQSGVLGRESTDAVDAGQP